MLHTLRGKSTPREGAEPLSASSLIWGSHPTNYLPPGRKSLADEAAGGSVTNEGNKDTIPRRRGKPMRLENQELELAEIRSDLSARDLREVEDYFSPNYSRTIWRASVCSPKGR